MLDHVIAWVLGLMAVLAFARFLFTDAAASGNAGSSASAKREAKPKNAITDNYTTLAQVEAAIRTAGLESSDLILAVDFTRSNTWQGTNSFGGLSLHTLDDAPGGEVSNPYQQVIATLSDVLLRRLDDDCSVPVYGFGDSLTGNRKVFQLNRGRPCRSKEELLAAYADAAAHVTLSGPTSFAPIIDEAVDVVRSRGKYHVLVIICDGLMDDVAETTRAIVAASNHPLSIIVVGVGDGPWSQMETFDDEIPARAFDNFQFVSYSRLATVYPADLQKRATRFALEALMELPDQYRYIKQAGMLAREPEKNVAFKNRLVGKHNYPSSVESVAPPAYKK